MVSANFGLSGIRKGSLATHSWRDCSSRVVFNCTMMATVWPKALDKGNLAKVRKNRRTIGPRGLRIAVMATNFWMPWGPWFHGLFISLRNKSSIRQSGWLTSEFARKVCMPLAQWQLVSCSNLVSNSLGKARGILDQCHPSFPNYNFPDSTGTVVLRVSDLSEKNQ